MIAIVIRHDGVESVREVARVARISRGAAVHVFGVHPALDAGEMTHEITNRPPISARTPFELVPWYEGQEATGAAADRGPVLYERCEV